MIAAGATANSEEQDTPLLDRVDLGSAVVAAFTRATAGNLSHRRPHLPSRLARRRARVAGALDLASEDLHFMQQVHGAAVGVVGKDTPAGAELRGVDALVTDERDRALVVQVADCVPVLLATDAAVGAIHAGRTGLAAGVVEEGVQALGRLSPKNRTLLAAIGPSIGGCCYEVPAAMRDEVSATYPSAAAQTTWQTPSLDLPAAVRHVLEDNGVQIVEPWMGCTRCDSEGRWFSHRRDVDAGRQVGLVARVGARAGGARTEADGAHARHTDAT